MNPKIIFQIALLLIGIFVYGVGVIHTDYYTIGISIPFILAAYIIAPRKSRLTKNFSMRPLHERLMVNVNLVVGSVAIVAEIATAPFFYFNPFDHGLLAKICFSSILANPVYFAWAIAFALFTKMSEETLRKTRILALLGLTVNTVVVASLHTVDRDLRNILYVVLAGNLLLLVAFHKLPLLQRRVAS